MLTFVFIDIRANLVWACVLNYGGVTTTKKKHIAHPSVHQFKNIGLCNQNCTKETYTVYVLKMNWEVISHLKVSQV